MPRRTVKRWKSCKCGKCFSKLEWAALPYCGEQLSESDRLVFKLELRHCPCGSTIGVETRQRKEQNDGDDKAARPVER